MSQYTPGVLLSIEAADSIPAHRVVVLSGNRLCDVFATSTSQILGVNESLVDSGAAASVIVSGTAKVQCNASIAAGSLVTPVTDGSGKIKAVTVNTSTAFPAILGIALQNGSTDASIEVLLSMERRTAGI